MTVFRSIVLSCLVLGTKVIRVGLALGGNLIAVFI